MQQSFFSQRFRANFARYAWVVLFLFGLFAQVNIRYFGFVRGGIYPGEAVFTTLSTLFWPLLPVVLASGLMALSRHRSGRSVVRSIITGGLYLWVAVCVFACIVDNYILSAYQSVFTDSIAINILGTNPSEAGEFISAAPWSFILYPTLFAFVWLLFSWLLRGRLSALVQRVLPKRESRFALLTIGGTVASGVAFAPAQFKLYQQGTPSFAYMVSHERIVQGTLCCLKQAEEVRRGVERLAKIDLGEVKQTQEFERINVLLIMGESLRRDYMHCYGYPVANTPGLDSLVASEELILFSNVVAPAPYTVGSIVENLTFHQLSDSKPWYEFPTLFRALSQGGYYTYWLSNQEKQGAYIQDISAISATADSAKYVKVRTSTDWAASYDAEAIPMLLHLATDSSSTTSGRNKLFQLVHIMGSHTTYDSRYPKEYDLFKTEDLPAETPDGLPRATGGDRDLHLVQYLNSIRYNDFVVSGMIKAVANEPAIVIYVADHGVEVHDNPNNPDHSGHPSSERGLRIPMMVYFSPQMRQLRPDLWETIKVRKDDRVMTDLMTHSVCGLLGVETKYHKPELNFFGAQYDQSRKRVVKAFDKVLDL